MRLTADAQQLISMLTSFDYCDFIAWIKSIKILVGSGHIEQYILEKRRWNTSSVLKERVVNINYSVQAMLLIRSIKEFDFNDFDRWYNNSLLFNKADIINYLEARNKK